MGVETLIIAGAAISAGSSAMKGQAEKKAAFAAGDQAVIEARIRAANIRRLAAQTRGEAVAGYAASGVDVSQGTPLEIDRSITKNSEVDALNTIISGDQQRRALRDQGVAAERGGYISAAASLLGGYAGVGQYSAWKTAAKGAV